MIANFDLATVLAVAGFVFAMVALAVTIAVVCFGDLFVKSEEAFRRWFDAIFWCVLGGLSSLAAGLVCTVLKIHH